MKEPTTAAERREMREAAKGAEVTGPFWGAGVDPSRLLALLDEHEAQAAQIERLREALMDAAGTAGRMAASERQAIDDRARLRNEQDLDRAAVRALMEKLPRCDDDRADGTKCAAPALWNEDAFMLCEEHMVAAKAPRIPDCAAPLRALQARMAAWGEAAVAPADPTDDSPRCEICSGPARDDDPGRVCGDEDVIYVCGACARKLDAGERSAPPAPSDPTDDDEPSAYDAETAERMGR